MSAPAERTDADIFATYVAALERRAFELRWSIHRYNTDCFTIVHLYHGEISQLDAPSYPAALKLATEWPT